MLTVAYSLRRLRLDGEFLLFEVLEYHGQIRNVQMATGRTLNESFIMALCRIVVSDERGKRVGGEEKWTKQVFQVK
jgi:hypothetical protein